MVSAGTGRGEALVGTLCTVPKKASHKGLDWSSRLAGRKSLQISRSASPRHSRSSLSVKPSDEQAD